MNDTLKELEEFISARLQLPVGSEWGMGYRQALREVMKKLEELNA